MLISVIEIVVIFTATETLLLPVQVDSPQVLNSVLDRLLIAVLAKEGGCNGEEGHILQLKLEDGCVQKTLAVS